MAESPISTDRKWDWLILMGIAITLVWVLGGVAYVFHAGITDFLAQGADTIGGFLEGFFAPLAFLWLVIGLFIQQRELITNTRVLKETQLTTEQQTAVLAETELRARQTAYFQIADNVKRQTGNLAGMLVESLVASLDLPKLEVDDEDVKEHWIAHQQGQYERFPAILVRIFLEESVSIDVLDTLYGDQNRRNYTEEYVRSFRELLRLGRECDPNGTIVRTTTQTPHGTLYESMLNHFPPSSCWVLIKDSKPFASMDENESFVGEWILNSETVNGNEEWHTTLWETENGHQGRTILKDGVIEHADVAIFNAVLFIRIELPQYPLILTAIIDEDVIEGCIDYREGIFATFTGRRKS